MSAARPSFVFVNDIGYPEEDLLHGIDVAEARLGLDVVRDALKADRDQATRHLCILPDDCFGGRPSEDALRALAAKHRGRP